LPFHEALRTASVIFGYHVYLSFEEYRDRYDKGRISESILNRSITQVTGSADTGEWKKKLLEDFREVHLPGKIGRLRQHWKNSFGVNLDKEVHAPLFRLTGGYLDQGVAAWNFPMRQHGFLDGIRRLESLNQGCFLTTERARRFLFKPELQAEELLHILVGDERLYEMYLFDQQFAHPGWSGMVAVLEKRNESLLDGRPVTLHDFVLMELLLELDALDRKFGENWAPLAMRLKHRPEDLFLPVPESEEFIGLKIWQEALEWSYFDQVLAGIKNSRDDEPSGSPSFQALFCIDDRECSLRRYVEQKDSSCRTYGTPGFFNVPFFFQPMYGKFLTKLCPAPLTPKHLIKETSARRRHSRDSQFSQHTHGLFGGWLIAQSLGFWSAVKLAWNILFPGNTAVMVSSFNHMDPQGKLTIEHNESAPEENGLQVGFTVKEMADSIEGLLKSVGLVSDFAPLVYLIGHGASSVNNTHYAGYDCGACCGRPGSVNARVAAFMGNHPEVRKILAERGVNIPETTSFIGALHDTTRDEIQFYDEEELSQKNQKRHEQNKKTFSEALDLNAKERSRRFVLMNHSAPAEKIHRRVVLRSVSLFEPRPELNHATNSVCLVGRRNMSRHLFLDRRSFLNSYDASIDPKGDLLFPILKAVAPVCGGINLEYYFSRTDNERLGAGTKLPHNVVGLFGVSNGMDGDLRTGLPSQMIEVHDPLRLLVVVEQTPEIIWEVIRRNAETFEWFKNEWVRLVSLHPKTKELLLFTGESFEPYHPIQSGVPRAENLDVLFESVEENFPVYELNQA
jgi:hypothetical protein